ncbi:class II glutamine amidotransferase [Methylomagnum ishizawai]|uniref:class II glutamine amidotransferase n=1 Tax=Methylomagnum ishizawai TaxID=1760988 RepID=UPI001C31F22F|nr:class II glutamine amidotransferase [Methylomagnum ishizawai]BBL76821.1 class II glutamine amidotransferase [Methylomagnum ishizawai]
MGVFHNLPTDTAMCQLLGMNCNVPTDICFSFEGFQLRGGLTDHHRDGWGIAFFEGRGCRVFLDSKATIESPVAELVRRYPIHSTNVIAHIRKATQGRIALENSHPFQRELWGRYWLFAHNGNLENYAPALSGDYRPVGDTDSERAFCHILDTFRREFPNGPPDEIALFGVLKRLCQDIAAHGTFNCLLSNGDVLYAHCSTQLHYLVRQAPFSCAHLVDQDVTVDFSQLTTPEDRVAVIATLPLTDNEAWTALRPRQLVLFRDGAPVEGL